ncbi:unnamed protein product, partial [marine sediment metagenome]
YKMNISKKALAVAIILLFVGVAFAPICSSNTYTHGKDYYFEDADVFVIGRCRTIGSDAPDPWIGGLFIGTRYYSEAIASNTSLERLHVLIRNESTNIAFFRLIGAGVYMFNAEGIFYWGAKGCGVRKIPPIVIIMCHAESVRIRGTDVEP